jgi:hypothetical protein
MPKLTAVFPFRRCIRNDEHKFVSILIPKNATTSMVVLHKKLNPKRFEGIKPGRNLQRWREIMFHKYSLHNQSSSMLDNDYYRFVFVRNPFSRLVSAYVNKLMNQKPEHIIPPLLKILGRHYTKINFKRRLTFRELVKYVYPLVMKGRFDVHFDRQTLWTPPNMKVDFIGRIENFKEDFAKIVGHLNLPIDINDEEFYQNISTYSTHKGKCCADWGLKKYNHNGYPPYKYFYDEELRKMAIDMYKKDFDRFGYSDEIA